MRVFILRTYIRTYRPTYIHTCIHTYPFSSDPSMHLPPSPLSSPHPPCCSLQWPISTRIPMILASQQVARVLNHGCSFCSVHRPGGRVGETLVERVDGRIMMTGQRPGAPGVAHVPTVTNNVLARQRSDGKKHPRRTREALISKQP